MEHQKRTGFTLSQLLASLVIITVVAFFLGSCLFMYSPGTHQKARQSLCASNMKQIGLAFMQYIQDYDQTFPPGARAIENDHTLLGWASTHDRNGGAELSRIAVGSGASTVEHTIREQLLGGYINNNLIFRCPSAPNDSGPLSYMMNDLAAGVSQQDFVAVANSVLICDGEDFAGNVGHSYDPNAPAAPAAFASDGTVLLGATLQTAPLRHSDGANYGYADGHVKYSKSEAIYFPSRFSTSRSHKDAKTGRILGPDPAQLNTKKVGAYNGTAYVGTFHIN